VRFGRALWLGLGLVAALVRAAAAQSASDLFQQGIRAYQRLEFEAATALLQRTLDLVPRDAANLPVRSRVLDYLAAAAFFRGNRDSAIAAFRGVLERDPRHHLDDLVFPPEISGLFEEVLRNTQVVVVETAADTGIRVDSDRWVARLLASSFHHVDVALFLGDSVPYRSLYSGPVWDTLTLTWDGRDSLGTVARAGRYTLSVVSVAGGRPVRVVRVPLEVAVIRRDTLPLPPPLPDSLLLPERTGRGVGVRSLFGGLGLGLAATALPAILANGENPTPARFVVGGAVSVAGIVGFLTHRAGRLIPANAAANQARRDTWRARAQAVGRENAERRRDVRLTVRAGTSLALGLGAR